MQSDEYKSWTNKADDNILWAKDNLKSGYYPLVCFLCQQAVELIFKGYLYKIETVPPKIHNLINIYKICEKTGLTLNEDEISSLDKLTDYYFESRYPDSIEIDLDNKELAEEASEFAQKIIDSVKKQIT